MSSKIWSLIIMLGLLSCTSRPHSNPVDPESPNYNGGTRNLNGLSINGSSQVNEISTAQYQCIAHFNDSSQETVSAAWSVTRGGAYAEIGASSGVLTTMEVESNHTIDIQAVYQGEIQTKTVTIINLNVTIDPPVAPTLNSVTVMSSSEIQLSWSNVSNETGYKIFRSLSSTSSFTQISTTGSDVTTYSDSGLNSGTTYYYYVKATNDGGDSGASTTKSATTQAQVDPKRVYFEKVWEGYSFQAMNFALIEAKYMGQSLGLYDEIGVFDGGICVGMIKLNAIITNDLNLVASADDKDTPEIDGFTAGHAISFQFWMPRGAGLLNVSSVEYIDIYTGNTYSTPPVFEEKGTVKIRLNIN
ncbi:fibronectin type III domain-containing protein [bacterium]|nr:fibronectin type III domain-containing protein [bacterium]